MNVRKKILMDNERLVKYHTIILLCVGVFFAIAQGIHYGPIAVAIIAGTVGAFAAFMLLMRRVIPVDIRVHIIANGSFLVAFICSAAINAVDGFALFLTCCIVGAMYFRKSVILGMAIVVNATVIVGILLLRLGLPGEFSLSWFINNFISMNTGIATLYVLTSIGRRFIESITFKSRETEELMKKVRSQNETIMSGINYAAKIQKNLLPVDAAMSKAFSDHSVIWKPRDMVGGDIYWMKQFDTGTVLCVCDCTGHSTPGALLTMLVTSALESIVWAGNCDNTANIIWQLDQRLSTILHVGSDVKTEHGIMDIADGCDLAVLYIAKDGSVQFSSGKTPVFVCDGNEVVHYKGQKIFVGEGRLLSESEVAAIHIPANPDNKFYVASDGLFDQIGKRSEDLPGMQFGYETFKQVILENHDKKLPEINAKVWDVYEEYRGDEERRDDFELISFVPKRVASIKDKGDFERLKAEDLFAAEQRVFENATMYTRELRDGAALDVDEFDKLVKEYGRMLRQLRRATRISDRATGNLNTSRMDLQGKVNFDSLTGIFNRRYMDDSLRRIVKSLARAGSHLGILMMDIDYFKKYNDTYGHSAGDECLKAVAETIAKCVSRPDDFVARYGGEEFSVILPNTDESGVRVMANKILEAVRARNIPHEKNAAAACVTISIGATSRKVKHVHTVEDFIKRADAALYESKMKGRNRYTFLEFKI